MKVMRFNQQYIFTDLLLFKSYFSTSKLSKTWYSIISDYVVTWNLKYCVKEK